MHLHMDRRTRSDHQRASSYWHAPDTYSCNQARRKINNTPAPESTPKGGCTRASPGTPPRRSTAARTPRVRPLDPNPRTQQYHHTHRQPAGLQGCVVMVSKTCSSDSPQNGHSRAMRRPRSVNPRTTPLCPFGAVEAVPASVPDADLSVPVDFSHISSSCRVLPDVHLVSQLACVQASWNSFFLGGMNSTNLTSVTLIK